MGTIRACIFDLDGVVVDTAKYHYLAWKRLANELGFDFSEEHNEKLKGVSRMESLRILLEVGGIALSMQDQLVLADKKNNWYKEYIGKMTPEEVLPGAISFFTELKSHGIKLGLGSASKNASTILERTNLMEWFDAIIDGNKTQKAKPDPEVFLLGAKALDTKPSECIVFEDAEAGIEAALNAGMRSVGIGDPRILGKANLVVAGLHEMKFEKLTL